MSYFNIAAQTIESTVVTEYESIVRIFVYLILN